MRVYDLIRKKRDGGELTTGEIRELIAGYTRGDIPDYQMAAFCMAVYYRGLNPRETADLTRSMADSGDQVDLSAIQGFKVDKHSTGGVADTTTLVLAPAVAACGIPVAKMSGRGLGHTGGTIDKLESIPGFRTSLSRTEFMEIVNRVGVAVIGQTADLAPADKKLYALRDVTATIDSIPLIASSVMSKKLAAGAQGIVLDVKWGTGAFMKKREDAEVLASLMVEIGKAAGRKVVAVVSDMNQPLGKAIGNALEIEEAVLTLKGKGPARLEELCCVLGGEMLSLAGKASSPEEGQAMIRTVLHDGRGLAKFSQWIAAQGGDPRVAEDFSLLPRAPIQRNIAAPRDGFIIGMEAEDLGVAAALLGAGRMKKDDPVDLAVGLKMHVEVGERVEHGVTPLATVFARREEDVAMAVEKLLSAIRIAPVAPPRDTLVAKVIR